MGCRRASGRKGKRVAHLLSTNICYQCFMHSFGLVDRDLRQSSNFFILMGTSDGVERAGWNERS